MLLYYLLAGNIIGRYLHIYLNATLSPFKCPVTMCLNLFIKYLINLIMLYLLPVHSLTRSTLSVNRLFLMYVLCKVLHIKCSIIHELTWDTLWCNQCVCFILVTNADEWRNFMLRTISQRWRWVSFRNVTNLYRCMMYFIIIIIISYSYKVVHFSF